MSLLYSFLFFSVLFFFACLRLLLSCRLSVGPSPRLIIGLTVPANSNLVPSGLGLRPARMHEVFCLFFLSFLCFFFFSFSPLFALFCISLYNISFKSSFFWYTHVPRICSWCYLAASDTGLCTTGRHSAAPFAYGYCGGRTVLFAFIRRDVYCCLFCDHGLDVREMS